MLKPSYLYRNARSGELLELFMVSAVSSLLLTRFFLFLTGFPSIGGRQFHIAHMLWGGLLMTAALVLLLNFIGSRVQRLASVVGGVGFGLFIDELGKFITRDNNYFFHPAVALIYLVFMLLFILFRSLSRHRRLSQREYLLNAVMMTEEAVIDDLDKPERTRVLQFLKHSDPDNPLVRQLRRALSEVDIVPEAPTFRPQAWLEARYRRIIELPHATTVIDAIFIIKALTFFLLIGNALIAMFTHTLDEQLVSATALQLLSSALAAYYVFRGVAVIRRSRLRAYEWFSRSLLVDIFITQFFSFYRLEFDALPGFTLNVLLYIALRFLLRQERRVSLRDAD